MNAMHPYAGFEGRAAFDLGWFAEKQMSKPVLISTHMLGTQGIAQMLAESQTHASNLVRLQGMVEKT